MFLDRVLFGRVTGIVGPALHFEVVEVCYDATPSVIAKEPFPRGSRNWYCNLRVSSETVQCNLALSSCQKHQSSTIRRMVPNIAQHERGIFGFVYFSLLAF